MSFADLPVGLDLLLATGGTGGHIYPALAVARAARARGLEVGFMGQAEGVEARLVPEAGFPFVGVAAGKWDRERPDPRQALKAASGIYGAHRSVRRARPRAVVGFGGFASFPGCTAAVLASVPLALHEGNAFPSRVNRWFSRRAALVVATFEEAALRLRSHAPKVVLPFPVREQRVERAAARRTFGIPEEALVTLVMGGSQGSKSLNKEVPDAFERLPEPTRKNLHVLHASGPAWIEDLEARVAGHDSYHPYPYVDAAAAWGAADLAITRAGIGTLSEAAFHGVPLVMVPLPTSAEGHQRFNAIAVQASGAGILVEEETIKTRLVDAWGTLLEPEARTSAAKAAAARSPAGAANAIVDTLLEHLLRETTISPTPDQGETV